MVLIFDQRFCLEGYLFPIGMTQQIAFAQGIKKNLAVILAKILYLKTLSDHFTRGFYVITFIEEQIF